MRARRFWAITRKEFIHIIRDPRSLGMAIAIPMLLLVLFGYALTLDVDNVAIVVWDRSNTVESRDFVSRFDGSPYFKVIGNAGNYHDLERAIDRGDAIGGLIIPEDFGARAHFGQNAAAQMIVDGSDSNTATIALGYADAVTLAYSQDILLRGMKRMNGITMRPPLDIRPRVWFNTDMESRNYIIPGLIATIMMVIAALLTSLTVAREWERGTMEQLISTPVRGSELIFGKLTPYFVIGMVDVTIAVLMGQFLFHVPLRGSVALLFGIAAVFLFGVLSMGILISVVAKTQLFASQVAMVLTFLPTIILSGFMFAITNMPKTLQYVTYAVPARYFITLLKGIYLKGIGLEIMKGEAALLVAFGILMALLANIKFKKKLV
jgi:ABC-2 type transport system permease protein